MVISSVYRQFETVPWEDVCGKTQLWQKETFGCDHRFLPVFDAREQLCPPLPEADVVGTHLSLECSNWDRRGWGSPESSNPLWPPCSQSLWSQARMPGPPHWCSLSESHPGETPGASGGQKLARPGWAQTPAGRPRALLPCCQGPIRASWHHCPLWSPRMESLELFSSLGAGPEWLLFLSQLHLRGFKGTALHFLKTFLFTPTKSRDWPLCIGCALWHPRINTKGESKTSLFWWTVYKYKHPQRGEGLEDDKVNT